MGSFLSTPGGEDDAVGVQHAEPLDTAASLAAADARFAAALQRPLPPQRAFQRRRTTSALPVRTLPTAWSPRSPLETNFKDDDVLETAQPLQDAQEPDPDISEDGPVSIESRVEYSALPKGASQAIFGLVTLRAAAQVASSERRHMDLVCVLDISGSMGDQNKIGDLKSAMRFIIDELQPTDRLSIVTFENFGHRCLRLRRMDSQGRDEATVQTMRLQAGGGTNIAEGLDLGLAVLEQRRQRNQVSAILLLTDGQDSSFRCAVPSMVQRASKAGAGLYAFGFGQDHDADLLRGVSEQAKTPYTFIEDTATVKEAFAGVVGGLSSVVAQNLRLKLDCSALLVDVNTPFEVEKSGDTKATVSIPDIFAGERRDVLLELSIPADLAGDDTGKLKLLEASVRYLNLQPPGSGFGSVLVQSPPETMFVQRTEEPQPEQEPDAEVADQRERVEVAKALATAATKSDSGQFDEARSLLKRQREKVSRRTSHITQALTLELEDAEHRMESQLSWQTGHAEVRDALSMHRMQRCTNSLMSSSSQVYKRSKTMYVTSVQEAWSRTASASSTDL